MPADEKSDDTNPIGRQGGSATAPSQDEPPAVDRRVLEMLVCPLTKTTLEYNAKTLELISRAAGLAFPIRNGVPLMIEDAARTLTDEDLEKKPAKPAK